MGRYGRTGVYRFNHSSKMLKCSLSAMQQPLSYSKCCAIIHKIVHSNIKCIFRNISYDEIHFAILFLPPYRFSYIYKIMNDVFFVG